MNSKQDCTAKAAKSSVCTCRAWKPDDRDGRGDQPTCVSIRAQEPTEAALLLSGLTLERNHPLQCVFLKEASFLIWVLSVSALWDCKQTSLLHSRRWQWFYFHESSPCPFLCFMVGSPRWQKYPTGPWKKVLFKDGLALFTLISSSVFESVADPQALPLNAKIQWIQLHHHFHTPAGRQKSPKTRSELPTLRTTFQNRAPPMNLRLLALIAMLRISESMGHVYETWLCDQADTRGQGTKRDCHAVENYKAFIKAAGKINLGPTRENMQSFTTLLSTYLALSFNDYDRHRSGRPAVFGWEGFITIP